MIFLEFKRLYNVYCVICVILLLFNSEGLVWFCDIWVSIVILIIIMYLFGCKNPLTSVQKLALYKKMHKLYIHKLYFNISLENHLLLHKYLFCPVSLSLINTSYSENCLIFHLITFLFCFINTVWRMLWRGMREGFARAIEEGWRDK